LTPAAAFNANDTIDIQKRQPVNLRQGAFGFWGEFVA
jgi:hypothetical protein